MHRVKCISWPSLLGIYLFSPSGRLTGEKIADIYFPVRLNYRKTKGLAAMTRTLVAMSLPPAFFVLLYAIAAAQLTTFAARALLSVAR
jgi:hypothetical protein